MLFATSSETNGTTNPVTGLASSTMTENGVKPKDWGIPESFLLPSGHPDYLRLILTSRVYEVVDETPLTYAINLSNRLESRVLLKREDLLPVFSFKLRGAYNKMAHLDDQQRWRGVIACSAGRQDLHYFLIGLAAHSIDCDYDDQETMRKA
ncbi:Threonine dehydratase-like protein AKTS1-1 [Ascosphaera pollenicola]|nr:Threonine dehydratase-like protein AKTS1-1 [Ascosphaera pollenicola]